MLFGNAIPPKKKKKKINSLLTLFLESRFGIGQQPSLSQYLLAGDISPCGRVFGANLFPLFAVTDTKTWITLSPSHTFLARAIFVCFYSNPRLA
ncbi:hypothetical protein CEXT_586341 [Caerostris extrusa]|uniref:Uncharacterized protein n=1 Tax=Caerostris extrusa TaxID=172846 RepID=A0AAV4RAT0_CAEEX|nr:hypothetical protein CEXT_586341 [Caerostris extrusa]